MLNATIANFLVDATKSSVISAGVAGIFEFANPKATAFGVVASKLTGLFFTAVVSQKALENSLLLIALFYGSKIIVGTKAGQQIDPKFSYFDACLSYGVNVFIVTFLGKILGAPSDSFSFFDI